MEAVKLWNGNLVVPIVITHEDGTHGDGYEEIDPYHPDYQGWLPFARIISMEEARPYLAGKGGA